MNAEQSTTSRKRKRGDQLWPMGAVTRRTGLGEHTLRAWERRFGFPKPRRLPSGHRRYTSEQVRQLMLVATALGCGYRAGDVVPLPLSELEALLRECGAMDRARSLTSDEGWMDSVFEAARAFDRDSIAAFLHRDAAALGVAAFMRDRVAPLLDELGQAWARGDLAVRHEHFVSEVLQDVLRSMRELLEGTAHGRPVVLATLPGERHGLGLHLAALVLLSRGLPVRILGVATPVEEIVEASRALKAVAVGLSVSEFAVSEDTTAMVSQLRAELPPQVGLWLGGGGAAQLEGLPPKAVCLPELDDLERELQRL